MKTKTVRIPRILTRAARLAHVRRYQEENPHLAADKAHCELLGDSATVNSNYVHNPVSGYLELAAGTPAWVARVASKRAWIATVGKLPWN